ncbi:MAG: hypothetical protein AAB352_03040 [Patescibacteria group bacterium]
MLDNDDIQKLINAQKEVFVTKEEFEGLIDIVATKDEMRTTNEKLGKIGDDIKEIKSLLIDFGGRTVNLENKVGYIENSFNIQPIKK